MNTNHGKTRCAHTARRIRTLTSIAMLCVAQLLSATELHVTVSDADGTAIGDAVLELIAQTKLALPHAETSVVAEMRQRDQQFSPQLLVVPVGASVAFPNDDPVLHHVYSFSPANTFELSLYGNDDVPSILFDRAGPVALGCNIHDHMRGYIYVSSANYFSQTGTDGTASFKNMPAAKYTLNVWHPRLRNPNAVDPVEADLTTNDSQSINLIIDMRPIRTGVIGNRERGAYE